MPVEVTVVGRLYATSWWFSRGLVSLGLGIEEYEDGPILLVPLLMVTELASFKKRVGDFSTGDTVEITDCFPEKALLYFDHVEGQGAFFLRGVSDEVEALAKFSLIAFGPEQGVLLRGYSNALWFWSAGTIEDVNESALTSSFHLLVMPFGSSAVFSFKKLSDKGYLQICLKSF